MQVFKSYQPWRGGHYGKQGSEPVAHEVVCKCRIVLTPKYRRKIIYNQYRDSLGEIFRQLCRYKGAEIIKGRLIPDHVHMLGSIPLAVSSFMGCLNDKSAEVCASHASLKCKLDNRRFWDEGYYVSTGGLKRSR